MLLVAGLALLVVLLMMLAEARLSRSNERRLRERGAVEPPHDVYRTMQWAYPAAFVALAVEGALFGPPPGATTAAGVGLFAAAKALKLWAIASLGDRWTFRVLVPPDAPLVSSGPYAFLRHPNYVGVIGELAGVALTVGARVTGPVSILGFALLIRRRIRVEERALGLY
jgi:methyltransferase